MNTICVKVGCFENKIVRASRGFTLWALDSQRGGFTDPQLFLTPGISDSKYSNFDHCTGDEKINNSY